MNADLKTLWLSFEGRATRTDYWLRTFLPILIGSIVVGIIDGLIGGAILTIIYSLVTLWPSLAVSIKRLHDRDMSGWWMLLIFLPLIGGLILLVIIGFLRGTVGENQYGADPLGGVAEA